MTKYTHLSQEQRYQIEALLKTGISKRQIAKIVGVHFSTIYRELKRNSIQKIASPDKYKAKVAHDFSRKRTYKPWEQKSKNKDIRRRMFWLLSRNWSPEQISETCKRRGLEMLSTEGIYLWIYQERKLGNDLTKHLRRHHRKRRKRRLDKQPRIIIKNKVSIHDRPKIIDEQGRIGDFETDLMQCKNGYLVTITERKTLFNIIEKIPNKEAASVQKAIVKALEPYKGQVHSITSDNGTEFAYHQIIAEKIETEWYFADPYKSQQRGCNENQNGLFRQYFKRDTNLDLLTDKEIKNIQLKLNARPRKKINFLSPIKYLSLNNYVALES